MLIRITLYFLFILSSAAGAGAQQPVKDFDSDAAIPVVFVVGKILRPAVLPWRASMTLREAIKLSGGTEKPEKKMAAVVTRKISECKQLSSIIDLRDLLKTKQDGFLLKPFDIVDIRLRNPKSKRMLEFKDICRDKIPVIRVPALP